MNRTYLRVGLLTCAILLGLGLGTGRAQTFPRVLEDIKVFSAQELEVVQFQFSKPYDGTPGEDFRRGELSLNFIGIGSNPADRSFQIRESRVLQEIRVAQGRYSTTVNIKLREPGATLQNRIDFTREGNRLRMAIRPTAAATARPAASEAASDKELLRQMERVIANNEATVTEQRVEAAAAAPAQAPAAAQAAAPAQGAASEQSAAPAPAQPTGQLGGFRGLDWLPTMITMVVALAIVCGALYGVAVLYNRLVGARLARLNGDHRIRVVASHYIGPKQRVVLVDIDGELFACGVTATQISFLTRLAGGGATPSGGHRVNPPAPPPATRPDPGVAPTKGGGANALSGQLQAAQQFADVLKQKVRSLKQIK